MGKALPENVKNKIFTLIHPRNKVLTIERILRNYQGEKWAVPMDLKDFHVQFGPTNHKTLMRCLERRLLTIRDSNIRREIKYLLSTLKDELCRGNLMFTKKTERSENLESAYDELDQKLKQHILSGFKYIKQDFNQIEEPKADQGEEGEEREEIKKNKRPSSDKCQNTFVFRVKNGLLSGWKLTSLMGSIYNNSTNTFCNFWHLNRFGLVPTNYITQGDDTHFKCRFMSQSMFHIGLVNSIGKIAHPKKQFFSTYMTEFLKKLYDLNEQKMHYSPCRMISSILFEKENRKSKANNKNNMKDIIDVWNLFLIRIPNEKRREYIVKKNYAQNCVRFKFKFHSGKNKLSADQMCKLFSTPSNINGYLLGPLTDKSKLYQNDTSNYENLGFNMMDRYFEAEMFDYKLKYIPHCEANNWKGINSMVSDMVKRAGRFRTTVDTTFNNKWRANLTRAIYDTIGESLKEYEEQRGDLGTIKGQEMDEYTHEFMQEINKKMPEIKEFFKENMKLYLNGYDLATPWAQLMVLNDALSKELESGLRKGQGGMNNFEVFETLSSMRHRCKFTNRLFNDMSSQLTFKTMFDFALSKEIGCSVCRYISHDEYLGMFSLIINESIPLLFPRVFDFKTMLDEYPSLKKALVDDDLGKEQK
jgi:hypothetical protein